MQQNQVPSSSAKESGAEQGPAEQDQHEATHVTASVARRIEPGREHDFIGWTDAGIALARTFPGFLGGGWLRNSRFDHEYYVVYRFADDAAMDDWQRSPVRKAWLERGEGVAVEYASHRLSGIEGWFEPQEHLTNAVRVVGAPPPRWKQAITIWLGFFPMSLLINFVVFPHLGDAPLVLKTLVATLINTPIMVYVLLPWLTGRLKRWLG